MKAKLRNLDGLLRQKLRTNKQFLINIEMCQCLICGCWWYNFFGMCCGGCHCASLVFSCWLCKPDDLRMLDPQCCHILACDGFGFNAICHGSVCFAPKAIREWSGIRSANKSGSPNSNKTILLNSSQASPIYIKTTGVNYHMNSGMNNNYNANINMNSNMGGVEMNSNVGGINMNANMGGMGMNTQMNMGVGANGLSIQSNLGMGVNARINSPSANAKISF